MNDVIIEIKQHLSDSDYKKALWAHYFAYKYTYITPVLGVLLLLLMLVCWIFYPDFYSHSGWMKISLYLSLGAYLVLRPYLYVLNVLKSNKASKLYAEETVIQITAEDKIITTSRDNTSSFDLKDLFKYSNKDYLLLLYLSKGSFFMVDKRLMTKEQIDYFFGRLDALQVERA